MHWEAASHGLLIYLYIYMLQIPVERSTDGEWPSAFIDTSLVAEGTTNVNKASLSLLYLFVLNTSTQAIAIMLFSALTSLVTSQNFLSNA